MIVRRDSGWLSRDGSDLVPEQPSTRQVVHSRPVWGLGAYYRDARASSGVGKAAGNELLRSLTSALTGTGVVTLAHLYANPSLAAMFLSL